jgi:hypothetical protein
MLSGVFTTGIKVPIRIGRDLFISPFFEIVEYVNIEKFLTRTVVHIGVGFSF